MALPASDRIDLAAGKAPRYAPPPWTGDRGCAPRSLTRWQRMVAAGVTLVLGGMLGVAAWLTPSPDGYGTHRQLGLPPCTIVQVFGARCPSCGMTTAWARVVRGQLIGALQANVGGTLLALSAIAVCPWLGWAAVRGHWRPGVPGESIWLALSLLVLAVTMIDWTVRWLLSS